MVRFLIIIISLVIFVFYFFVLSNCNPDSIEKYNNKYARRKPYKDPNTIQQRNINPNMNMSMGINPNINQEMSMNPNMGINQNMNMGMNPNMNQDMNMGMNPNMNQDMNIPRANNPSVKHNTNQSLSLEELNDNFMGDLDSDASQGDYDVSNLLDDVTDTNSSLGNTF